MTDYSKTGPLLKNMIAFANDNLRSTVSHVMDVVTRTAPVTTAPQVKMNYTPPAVPSQLSDSYTSADKGI